MVNKLTLACYSATATLLLKGPVHAEVIYTDVDPDVIVDVPGTGVELDLNDDGTADFNFIFSTTNFFNVTYFGAFNFYLVNAIFATPLNSNRIAALEGPGTYVYPYVIGSGLDIGPATGNFSDAPYQTMVYQFYALISSFFYYPIVQAGEWIFGQTDKFVGLEIAVGDSTYYGWMRLDVAVNNRSFTIKDLAFEDQSNTAISTFITPSGMQNPETTHTAIYASGNTVYVSFTSLPSDPVTISVYTLTGQLIHSEQTTAQHLNIPLSNVATGNYIVHCGNGKFSESRQIHLQE